jgi:hypothetical protein
MEQTTLQQGLNSVVINKVQRMIENKQTGVRETLQRLAYEGQIAQDYIAPLGVELRQREHAPVIRFTGDGELMMTMRHQQFSLHENAVGQLAEKMDVPSQYLRALAHGNGMATASGGHRPE